MAPRYSSRGTFLAAAIVAANLLLALQITGLSYGRFEWTALAQSYDTPSPTPAATATPTRIPLGGGCTDPAQCASGFCATGVCCDEACSGPGASCDVPGQVGTCVRSAPAPVLSGQWLAVAALMLTGLGLLALRGRRAP